MWTNIKRILHKLLLPQVRYYTYYMHKITKSSPLSSTGCSRSDAPYGTSSILNTTMQNYLLHCNPLQKSIPSSENMKFPQGGY
jgi:hypothetical protein